jgi:uncharacterized protein (TIGR01319 family)
VLAGNIDVQDAVVMSFLTRGKQVIPTANVLPRIGVLDPGPARATIRDVFVRHVIGGKNLSRRGQLLASLIKAATPDAVLAGVEVLADGASGVAGAGDVLVVDVGGATTDVYSVLTPDPEESTVRREVVEAAWRGRSVEGDLGVRWSALGLVEAAKTERLLEPAEAASLWSAAQQRAADPTYLAPRETAGVDVRLAGLAAVLAVRRHARPEIVVGPDGEELRRGGRDLRRVGLVVGSGGALRHTEPPAALAVLEAIVADVGGGWPVPEQAKLVVDRDYVLAAAGLLALTGRTTLAANLLLTMR